MFTVGNTYSKNDIYEILKVPVERRKGAWDTGYREYEGNLFIFSNVGIPGRTGHDYNNYWDGDLFVWEGKTLSNINQPLILKMRYPKSNQNNFLFTRTDDKEPFTFEGRLEVKEFNDTTPVQIVWKLLENNNYPLDREPVPYANEGKVFYEGAVRQIVINKYERNPLARRICVNHYGAFCQACGFDFFKTYCELGKDFIHVHHIVPLSKINKEYILNPIDDLIPVCPNCHSMIHRNKTALSIEELKKILKNN